MFGHVDHVLVIGRWDHEGHEGIFPWEPGAGIDPFVDFGMAIGEAEAAGTVVAAGGVIDNENTGWG